MEVLDIYVDVVLADGAEAAERRFPGAAAYLRACGPCGEDHDGLLAAVTVPPPRDRAAANTLAVREVRTPPWVTLTLYRLSSRLLE